MKIYFGLMVLLMFVGGFGCKSKLQNSSDTETKNNISSNEISHINSMSTFNTIINGDKPVLVDFYADWCAPCKMMTPILEQVNTSLNGQVKILKVNVDKNRDAASKYGIQSIPTLILFQNGELKWKGVGVIQADKIEQIVKTKSTL